LQRDMNLTTRLFTPPKGSYFLFGPRGTGKSVWTRMRYPDALRVDLLEPDVFREFQARPERLRQLVEGNRKATTVVVDEVQKVPQLLDVVHGQLEGRRKVQFVLTGSSARKLRRSGVDLLAGRALLCEMHPFVAAELGGRFTLDGALAVGTVPLVVMADEPEDTLRSYAALYLREEVQVEGLVRNLGAFSRFLEAVSFCHGGVFSASAVSRDCQVERKTVENYVSILEDLLLAYRVPVFTRRAKRLLATQPKFYLFDTGVYRSLRPAGPLDRPEEIGGVALEGLVAQHLRAWCSYSRGGNAVHYWRTRAGLEVDLVVYGQGGIHAFEVINSRQVRPEDVRGLRAFGSDYPEARRVVLYRGSERIRLDDGIECMPVREFLAGLIPDSMPE
jgi:uncharacterized protein